MEKWVYNTKCEIEIHEIEIGRRNEEMSLDRRNDESRFSGSLNWRTFNQEDVTWNLRQDEKPRLQRKSHARSLQWLTELTTLLFIKSWL